MEGHGEEAAAEMEAALQMLGDLAGPDAKFERAYCLIDLVLIRGHLLHDQPGAEEATRELLALGDDAIIALEQSSTALASSHDAADRVRRAGAELVRGLLINEHGDEVRGVAVLDTLIAEYAADPEAGVQSRVQLARTLRREISSTPDTERTSSDAR